MADCEPSWRYRAAGFMIESAFAFAQLSPEPADNAAPADVLFTQGDPPDDPTAIRVRHRNFGYSVSRGRVVTLDAPAGSVPDAIARVALTGGLNAIAYQRGLLPLHGSAVVTGETCVVFCGDSGAGKSTLAAALAQAGFVIASDDLAVAHPDGAGGALIWPTMARPKLNRRSLDILAPGVDLPDAPAHWEGKAVASFGPPAPHIPRRLAAIYLLAWGEPGLRRLSPLEAAGAMDRCLRQPRWLATVGGATAIRQQWLTFATQTPVMRLSRRRDAAAPVIPPALLADLAGF